jgi:hypothetical protein
MFRKLSISLVTALLAFTAACSSSSGTNTASGSAANANVVAASAPNACPTSETKKFAKTLFVTDTALAGGAFKRYIYTPAKEGKFKNGAKGKAVALVKAATAGVFVIGRLNAARANVESDPTLCKLISASITKFSAAVTGLIGKTKGGTGSIGPSDVDGGDSLLGNLHTAATKGGTGFNDNTSTNA